jgi:hypothetical protein
MNESLRYWITVHWPHPVGDQLPWSVYLRDMYYQRGMGQALNRNDLILFYQTAEARDESGPIHEVKRIPSGERVALKTTPNGLIAVGTALEKLGERAKQRIQFNYGGNPYDWKWEARCKTVVFAHSVPHSAVEEQLHYRMFFAGGLKEIGSSEFGQLLGLLLQANGRP